MSEVVNLSFYFVKRFKSLNIIIKRFSHYNHHFHSKQEFTSIYFTQLLLRYCYFCLVMSFIRNVSLHPNNMSNLMLNFYSIT